MVILTSCQNSGLSRGLLLGTVGLKPTIFFVKINFVTTTKATKNEVRFSQVNK